MIFTSDSSQVVKEAFSPELVRTIDESDLREYAALLSFENAKIILCGKELLAQDAIIETFGNPISPIKKDQWFKTSHRLYAKPTEL